MENFKLIKIEESLKNSLSKMNFIKPTPIQGMAIPIALEGKDILGTAQTGTGKTLAFSIPLINKLILDKNAYALVMCPTRELASQVMSAIKSIISDKINIKTALLIGGEAMQKQLRQLGNRSRIIVGTPGRINDHLKRRSLDLSKTKYLVLDETDRMLDMGFTPQIELVLKFIPKDHQTLLFSATLPENILRISDRYLKNFISLCSFNENFDKKRGKYHYDSSVFPYICTAVIKGKWNYKEYKKELFEIFYNKKFNFFSYFLSRIKS